MDPVTLEVTITDALRRPLGQLTTETLCDLLALAESPQAPASMAPTLGRFRDRIAREIADVPDGPPWVEFVAEVAALAPARVPDNMRQILSFECRREERLPASAGPVEALEPIWERSPPVPFALGTRGTRVVKGRAAPPPPEPLGRRAARPAADREEKPPKAEAEAPKKRAPVILDTELHEFLIQKCIERLAPARGNGLAENVLLISVRKQAESKYPGVKGTDVELALKVLQDRKMIRRSAGRFILEGRW
jgi:hypothetical protein